jgi:hypothetical protein
MRTFLVSLVFAITSSNFVCGEAATDIEWNAKRVTIESVLNYTVQQEVPPRELKLGQRKLINNPEVVVANYLSAFSEGDLANARSSLSEERLTAVVEGDSDDSTYSESSKVLGNSRIFQTHRVDMGKNLSVIRYVVAGKKGARAQAYLPVFLKRENDQWRIGQFPNNTEFAALIRDMNTLTTNQTLERPGVTTSEPEETVLGLAGLNIKPIPSLPVQESEWLPELSSELTENANQIKCNRIHRIYLSNSAYKVSIESADVLKYSLQSISKSPEEESIKAIARSLLGSGQSQATIESFARIGEYAICRFALSGQPSKEIAFITNQSGNVQSVKNLPELAIYKIWNECRSSNQQLRWDAANLTRLPDNV